MKRTNRGVTPDIVLFTIENSCWDMLTPRYCKKNSFIHEEFKGMTAILESSPINFKPLAQSLKREILYGKQ